MSILLSDKIEREYSKDKDIFYRRSLGQFFTPFDIARFMSEWILGSIKSNLRVLDPSAGFGVFERSIVSLPGKEKKDIEFDLWEIDDGISKELREIISDLNISANVTTGDFLKSPWNRKYDGIIANPPYYKHHYIENKERVYQEFCVKTFFKFSIQTNIYCWFLIKAINLLADDGRLSFIIPSEFLNSNYGVKVKEYLVKSGIIAHLINVNFKENIFNNALTTSIIVLGEKKRRNNNVISLYNVSSTKELTDLEAFLSEADKTEFDVTDLNPKVKWRNYFNGNECLKSRNFISFSKLGRFSRGIATGANHYFTISEKEKNKFGLPDKCLKPCITKAYYAKGIIFRRKDFERLKSQDKKVYLFDGEASQDAKCKKYIDMGVKQGINRRYLTGKRDPWFTLEKRKISKIWAGVFGRKDLKFIWNETDCVNLTCFHAFYPSKLGQKYSDVLFVYLNTDFAKKLFDREKREYGDGLGKFEPNDINKSLAFDFEIIKKKYLAFLRELQKELINGNTDKKIVIQKADSLFNRIFNESK